jgi:hypothetical protein
MFIDAIWPSIEMKKSRNAGMRSESNVLSAPSRANRGRRRGSLVARLSSSSVAVSTTSCSVVLSAPSPSVREVNG